MNTNEIRYVMNDFITQARIVLDRDIEYIYLPITINKRLKNTMGRFHFKVINGIVIPMEFQFSDKLFLNYKIEDQLQVIYHEVVHYIANIYYNKNVGHTERFKVHCRALGIDDSTHFNGVPIKGENAYKYEIHCLGCGSSIARYKRMSQVKKMDMISGMYMCKKCKSNKLTIIEY
ncbi:SprT-like domain-containing protein [Terrisporobacter sp.]|uniref:SprT-like domain-containing protein n=1 Tax=Terrisporobacter sp. TaxID=1965305 RepID=UPI0039956C98